MTFSSQNRKGFDTMSNVPTNDEQLRAAVSERYGQAALQVLNAGQTTNRGCCGSRLLWRVGN